MTDGDYINAAAQFDLADGDTPVFEVLKTEPSVD